jgi:GH43 family beta-xylosidase
MSKNLVEWEEIGPVYTATDSWGYKDFWAPEVVEFEGKYYMYYTARWSQNDSLRIGVAISESPMGPFTDVYNHPMFDFGYAAIDANVLIDDDGQKYLYYSRDCSENVVEGRHESHIYGVKLKDDMISIEGEPTPLIKPDQEWEKASGNEWRWNEGPTVFKKSGLYYLMYSANFYADKAYSIGYATSENPMGPYIKYEKNPIISADKDWDYVSGTGHNSITLSPDGSEWFIVYHTHTVPIIGGGDRQVCIDRMGFRQDGSIYVNGPTITEQMMPSGSTDFSNISKEARVTVSSLKKGYSEKALTDGEIGIYEKDKELDWVSEEKGESEWIKLSWDKERSISSILLYRSAFGERTADTYKILLNTGEVIKDISFPEKAGGAAVVSFPQKMVKSVKIVMNKSSKSLGLSEVVVIGK